MSLFQFLMLKFFSWFYCIPRTISRCRISPALCNYLWSCGTPVRKRCSWACWWGSPPVNCWGTSPWRHRIDPGFQHVDQGLLDGGVHSKVPENLRRISKLCLDHNPIIHPVGVLHAQFPISFSSLLHFHHEFELDFVFSSAGVLGSCSAPKRDQKWTSRTPSTLWVRATLEWLIDHPSFTTLRWGFQFSRFQEDIILFFMRINLDWNYYDRFIQLHFACHLLPREQPALKLSKVNSQWEGGQEKQPPCICSSLTFNIFLSLFFYLFSFLWQSNVF